MIKKVSVFLFSSQKSEIPEFLEVVILIFNKFDVMPFAGQSTIIFMCRNDTRRLICLLWKLQPNSYQLSLDAYRMLCYTLLEGIKYY